MGQENDTTKPKEWKQLNERDRYKIEALHGKGFTPTEISKALHPKRDRRTIEREVSQGMTLQRNSDLTEKMVYLADVGQRKHDEKASNKGRGLKIGHDHKLALHIENKIINEKYSPDAVIGEIKAQGLEFEVTICTKTVYNMIDGGMFLNLTNKDLPVKKDGKKRGYNKVRKVALNNTKGRSIEERPPEVENRDEYGHWEMDCVVGSGKACLLVMTERMSRQEKIFKMEAKTQQCTVNILNRLEQRLGDKFNTIFKSITMDNGSEFLNMDELERSFRNPDEKRTVCYYAHPYSAYERGSNENANKLIRRFIPKGSDISAFSEEDIKRIEMWMNNYPRRLLGYKTANHFAA
jgi:IS30 family transposase